MGYCEMSCESMTADLLYGVGAPYTTHNDLFAVKAGDIVKLYDAATKDEHWVVVMGTGSYDDGVQYYITCDGNANGKVSWRTTSTLNGVVYYYPDSTVYSFY